jgi:hypothetical protein
MPRPVKGGKTVDVPAVVAPATSANSQNLQNLQASVDPLISLCDGCEFWRATDGVPYATIPRNGHRENWRIEHPEFRDWLSHKCFVAYDDVPTAKALKDAVHTLCGLAKYAGKTYPVFLRVAEHDGRTYIDLVDDHWRAIEIDSTRWRVVDSPPVRFRRVKAMLPLPVPDRGGSVSELREFVNVSDRHWPLLLAWLVTAFRPNGPYPILKLLGEQGSAKTTTARVVRSLIDPNSAPVRSATQSERDLMISANNAWIVGFDNLSSIKPEYSDALCRLSTGGGFSTRTLYKNDEETIFDAKRPIILNGISDMGFRSDLIDRSLVLELPEIERGQRRSEESIWAEFEVARPRILGALFTAVAGTMQNLPNVAEPEKGWPRMADFAKWAVAAEVPLGISQGGFLKAYNANYEEASFAVIESSPILSGILFVLNRDGKIHDTASNLLGTLVGIAGRDSNKLRDENWPKNAKALSQHLNRIKPNLRLAGFEISRDTEDNKKRWLINLPKDKIEELFERVSK